MDTQTVVRGAHQRSTGKPPGAMNSVFDTAAAAKTGKPPRDRTTAGIDPQTLQIERGVPLPQSRTGTTSPWPAVYARMAKGDMVRLSRRQGTSFMSWGKKHKPSSLVKRMLAPDSAGVWRVA